MAPVTRWLSPPPAARACSGPRSSGRGEDGGLQICGSAVCGRVANRVAVEDIEVGAHRSALALARAQDQREWIGRRPGAMLDGEDETVAHPAQDVGSEDRLALETLAGTFITPAVAA